MNQRQKAVLISLIILMGFVFSVFFYYIKDAYIHNFNLGFPYTSASLYTFLCSPWGWYSDFHVTLLGVIHFNPYGPGHLDPSNYFPLTYLILYPFTLVKEYWAIGASILVFGSTLIWFCAHYLLPIFKDKVTFLHVLICIVFLSYPTLFCFDRGNVEGLFFIFLVLFIVLYEKGHFYKAAIWLALATGIKLLPILYSYIFFKNKQYKPLIFMWGLSLFLLIFPLFLFPKGFMYNLHSLISSFSLFCQRYIMGPHVYGIQYSSSIFSVVCIILKNILHIPYAALSHSAPFGIILKLYFWIAVLFFFTNLFFLQKAKENVLWKYVAIISILIDILPYVSFDYKLINMLLPMMLFISRGEKSRFDSAYCVLFALIMIPKSYFILHPAQAITSTVILSPLILLTLLILIQVENVMSPLQPCLK